MRVLDIPVPVWDGTFTRPHTRDYSISFCTTCMGRVHDFVQTFPRNLADAASYPHVEFVILDYNSRDGLEEWVAKNLMPQIESGRVVYAKTSEPRYYSMAHSRNVAFKIASGDLVCNVDADNWIAPGFPEILNRLANERPERAIFAKGHRLLRGRIAFFRHEWEHLLGGYSEELQGYGHDDRDLVNRAQLLGFALMWFGGTYVHRLRTPSAAKVANMETPDWRATEERNKELSAAALRAGRLKANAGRRWGAARVTKNFREVIEL